MVAISVFSATTKSPPVCGNLADGYAPIIAFEMARSVNDLHAIFGAADSDCRAAITAQLDTINWFDVFIYIPTYGAFLIFFLLGMRNRDSRLASPAIRVALVACAADYAENICLFQLSANPDSASKWLSLLAWATEIKWVGLGVVGALAGYLLASRGGAWRLTMIPCVLGLLAALATIPMAATVGPSLSLAFASGWIVLLAIDVRESFRNATSPG
jgi:hypothetical protein